RDVAEEEPPILRRSIRRDEGGRRFMATHEDLEEVLGRIRAELLHAEVLEYQQVDACELLDQVTARAGGVRLGKVGGEIERAANERAPPRANRADRDGRGDMRFADAGWPDQEHPA